MNLPFPSRRAGFTLVELLIVISIIGIIAAMVITSYSNAAQDSRRVVAYQQQVEVQLAINNWIAGEASVAGARAAYNGKATALERFQLAQNYLDAPSRGLFEANGDGEIRTEVMEKVGMSLSLPDWAATAGSYPQVIRNE